LSRMRTSARSPSLRVFTRSAGEADQRKEDGLRENEARSSARPELDNLATWGWLRLGQLARDAGYALRQVYRIGCSRGSCPIPGVATPQHGFH
jgi:hypothetical protein